HAGPSDLVPTIAVGQEGAQNQLSRGSAEELMRIPLIGLARITRKVDRHSNEVDDVRTPTSNAARTSLSLRLSDDPHQLTRTQIPIGCCARGCLSPAISCLAQGQRPRLCTKLVRSVYG